MADVEEDFSNLTEEDLEKLALELEDDTSTSSSTAASTRAKSETSQRSSSVANDSTPPAFSKSLKASSSQPGEYDPDRLTNFLRKQAEQAPENPNFIPFSKPNKPSGIEKQPEKSTERQKSAMSKLDADDELLATLTGQSEEDVLKMMEEMNREEAERGRSIVPVAVAPSSHVVKATPVDPAKDDGVNATDLQNTLKKVQNNDSSTTKVNLNNHPDMTVELAIEFARALAKNIYLADLQMANAKVNDSVCTELASSLKQNKTLQVLNLETNEITGKVMKQLIAAIVDNKSLVELKLTNQSHSIGDMYEQEIARLIEGNDTIRKLALSCRGVAARGSIERLCSRNSEAARKRRQAQLKK